MVECEGMDRFRIAFFVTVMCTAFLMGCTKKQKEDKIEDIEYTVCEEGDLPKKLVESIEEKKTEEFELTYNEEGYMYIVKGYGTQRTGGYSIVVDELYMSENNVYFATTLKGPSNSDMVLNAPTFPYIVVKIEQIDKETVFE